MSKAEDFGYSKYPKSKKGVLYDLARNNIIEGYRQAEKDLDISWVKEVSGVKEMSRAKEEALKAYPPQSIAANYDTIDRRDAFEYGYLKAEKDLELTVKDIKKIYHLVNEVSDDLGVRAMYVNIYQEALKRFKNYKERKEK